MAEPVPVIPLAYEPPQPPHRQTWRAVVKVCHPVALFACAVAWCLLVFVKVESVLFTGPALLTLGVLLIIGGALTGNARSRRFGVGHVSICILFFLLVNLLEWGPSDSERPFTVMGGLYACGAVGCAIVPQLRASGRGRPRGSEVVPS